MAGWLTVQHTAAARPGAPDKSGPWPKILGGGREGGGTFGGGGRLIVFVRGAAVAACRAWHRGLLGPSGGRASD